MTAKSISRNRNSNGHWLSHLDLVGQKFNRLIVVERVPGKGHSKWLCRCDCGNFHIARGGSLKDGRTGSCGCIKAATTHGYMRTRTHNIWVQMLGRCRNPKNSVYADYGGRGITVCNEWHEFKNFLADMGEAPDDLTIDRLDNNAGYSKQNCAWKTRKEQGRNRRNNRTLTYNGETMCISAWAEKIGIGPSTLWTRLSYGWYVEDVLTTPAKPRYRQPKLP